MSAQRKSVFPPLLSLDAERGHREKCVHVPDKKETAHGDRASTGTRPVSKQRTEAAKAARTSNNKRDTDLRKRKHEKAEALVRTWDSLLVKEKEDKHAELLQRLELQHKLIAKNDLLSKQAEREEREKQAKELQFHRDFQRQMVQNLKAHNKRVMEHKKMVKKKLGDFGPVSHTCQDPSPESPLSGLPEEGCTVQQDTPPHQSYERELPSRAGQTSRMQQILNFDPLCEATPTIPNAWDALKQANERRMLPFVEYSRYARKFANPTSRRLLMFYDQPIRVDSKTGERMPLLEVMDREVQALCTGLGTQSKLTKALELRTRKNQVRAEILLHRKQQHSDIPLQKRTISMYLPEDELADNAVSQLAAPHAEHGAVLENPFSTNHQTKKNRLPKYLTDDGTITCRPSEEVGEKMYYNWQPITERYTKAVNSLKSTTQELEGLEVTDNRKNHRTRWLPLSSSAVQEYEDTHVLPVKLFSSQHGHGVYSMWKPTNTYTECANS